MLDYWKFPKHLVVFLISMHAWNTLRLSSDHEEPRGSALKQNFPVSNLSKEPTGQCRRCRRCRFDPWAGKIPWSRVPPVFLPGEFPGQERLVGYSPQGHKESEMTEMTQLTHTQPGICDNLRYMSCTHTMYAHRMQVIYCTMGS